MNSSRLTGFFFSLILTAIAAGSPLAESPEAVTPLAVGSSVSTAKLVKPDGGATTLAEAIAGQPTILIFYRGGWCPFCNRHLAALAENEIPLRKLGFKIVGLTPDRAEALAPTAKETQARYQLFSDRAMEAAGAFGIAFRLSAETGARYRKNNIDVPEAPDGRGFWQPVPSAFILSADGVVRFVYHNADPEHPISPEALLAAAESIARGSDRQ